MNGIELIFWQWWALAAILLVVEVLVPSFFFLWLAAAGFTTGIIVWLFAMTMNTQIFIFSVLAISAIVLWKITKNGSSLVK
jgi:membrane protein implicated in regulation of membrane protease activity